MWQAVNEDYLCARLHGKRSRMVEGDRLDQFSRLASVQGLAQALDCSVCTAVQLQQQIQGRVIQEAWDLSEAYLGPRGDFLKCDLNRYRLAKLKVILRALEGGKSLADAHLIPLPKGLDLKLRGSKAPQDIGELAECLADDELGPVIRESHKRRIGHSRMFFIEADLDRAYCVNLISAASALSASDKDATQTLVRLQADTFLLLAALRGRFSFDLPSDQLASLHLEGTQLSRNRYAQILSAPDPQAASSFAIGKVLEGLPLGSEKGETARWMGVIEALLLSRYQRLANQLFRRDLGCFVAVVGFLALRRIELGNLTTLSEGLRLGIAADRLRQRLIPRTARMEGEVRRD